MVSTLFKPEYFFQPRVLIRRLLPKNHRGASCDVLLPWKLTIAVSSNQDIGRAILGLGVYDLVVTETLWRLTRTADVAADIGANIGYMSSVFAARLGPQGLLLAFEPHPVLFGRLSTHFECWKKTISCQSLYAAQFALADKVSEGLLAIPSGFTSNDGLAHLEEREVLAEEDSVAAGEKLLVRVQTLPKYCEEMSFPPPDIVKMDVEGGELHVLMGMEDWIQKKRVRDFVFEDHQEFPSRVMQFFLDHGYELFRLQKGFFSPRLVSPALPLLPGRWEPVSYLATVQPDRAKRLLRGLGWRALSFFSF